MSVEPNFVKIGQNIKIMRIRKGVTQISAVALMHF